MTVPLRLAQDDDAPQRTTPPSILVVDDEEPIRDLCSRVLSAQNYDVQTAATGDDALALLSQKTYDLVLTDLKMPGALSGQGLTREIAQISPATQVVIMTGYPDLETAIVTMKHGAADYLIKPLDIHKIQGVVGHCLRSRELSHELNRERLLRKELQAAYEQLEEMDQMKEAFIARLNHEVRTPFMGIFHHLSQIQTDVENSRLYVGPLREKIAQVWDLMQNLLLLSQSSEGSFALAERSLLDPRILLRQVAQRFKTLSDGKQITVEFSVGEGPLVLFGDADALTTAFKHFFLNAVHFNKRGGRIRIEVKGLMDWMSIRFIDTGIGIPQDKLAKIFDSFYQVAAYLTREVGGLGVGLTVARRIIEAHGGRVSVSSREREGSIFEIVLPQTSPGRRSAKPQEDLPAEPLRRAG